MIIHTFDIADTAYHKGWIWRPYWHWEDNVAEEHMIAHSPLGYGSPWFSDWIKHTYNLEWHHKVEIPYVVQVAANSEADWLRFYLEWAD